MPDCSVPEELLQFLNKVERVLRCDDRIPEKRSENDSWQKLLLDKPPFSVAAQAAS
jgi:hypothetical protein